MCKQLSRSMILENASSKNLYKTVSGEWYTIEKPSLASTSKGVQLLSSMNKNLKIKNLWENGIFRIPGFLLACPNVRNKIKINQSRCHKKSV